MKALVLRIIQTGLPSDAAPHHRKPKSSITLLSCKVIFTVRLIYLLQNFSRQDKIKKNQQHNIHSTINLRFMVPCIIFNNRRDVTVSRFSFWKLYMFRVFLVHHQESLNCLGSHWYTTIRCFRVVRLYMVI
jgi:hypothetical protein